MSFAAGTAPGGWGLVAMTVLLILFVGLSVAAGYLMLFRGARSGRRVRRSTAQRRLDDQLARGQIDGQEYLRLSAELADQPVKDN